jgi:hypothetical protein
MNTRIIYGQELVFSETSRTRYMWGGVKVPGVTTILGRVAKPFLIQWSADMAAEHFLREVMSGRNDFDAIHADARVAHAKKRDASGDSGSNIHLYAENFFKGLPLPELKTDEAKRGVEAFHKWLNSHKVEILASEQTLYSKQYHYAGTCDFTAKIDGVLVVGDFKTGKRIYDEARLQTAAYQHALQEETGDEFAYRLIIRFCKETGEFETKEFRDFQLDFEGFAAALILHRTLQKIEAESPKQYRKSKKKESA